MDDTDVGMQDDVCEERRMFTEVPIKVSINAIAAQCFVPFVYPMMQIGNPRLPGVASAAVAKRPSAATPMYAKGATRS